MYTLQYAECASGYRLRFSNLDPTFIACVCVYACACVCVREREREGRRESGEKSLTCLRRV